VVAAYYASLRFWLVGTLALLPFVRRAAVTGGDASDYVLGAGETYRTPGGDTVFEAWRLGIAVSGHGPVAVFTIPSAATVLHYSAPSQPRVIALSSADTSRALHSEAIFWRRDTLVVIDKHLNRVARIDSRGGMVSVDQLPRIRPVERFEGMLTAAILEDGSLLALPYLTQTDLQAGTKSVPVLRFPPGSARGEQIARLRLGIGTFILPTIDGSIVVQSPPLVTPFDNSSFLTFGPNGRHVYLVERDVNASGLASLRILRLSRTNGRRAFATVWREQYPARQASNGYIDSLVDYAATQFDTVYGSHPAAVANVRAAIHIRPALAPVTDVQVAPDEALWLQREKSGSANCLWKRLDLSKRRYTGTLTASCIWQLAAAVGDTAWMTRFLRNGVLLRRFQLVPASKVNTALR
jgi:hypothetical protein